MRGHIRQWRNAGTFKIWLELPTVDDKRKQETFVVHGSRKDAEAKLDTLARLYRKHLGT